MPDARVIPIHESQASHATPLTNNAGGPPAVREQEPWERRAGVTFEANIYDSIVVAAFGGVTQSLAKTGPTLVHPSVLFVLSLLLLTTQASTLMFFRLDQDFVRPIWWETHSEIAHQRQVMLLTLKLMMIIIVQLVLFGKLLGTLRLFVFSVNPSTWDEIERPDPHTMVMKHGKWLFKRGYLAPFAILAMMIHASVNYTVCIDSISIILASRSVKDAIYDSLAITFIADLPVTWWTVVAAIFHFDSFDKFEFRLMDPETAAQRRNNTTAFAWLRLTQWTRRGYGARRVEVVFSFFILMLLYFRQVFVVVHALHTNVLPIARDVCTFWRWSTGKAEYMRVTAFLFRAFEQHFLVMDPTHIINAVADPNGHVGNNTGFNHTGFCNGRYDRLHMSDILPLLERYPRRMVLSFVVLVFAICLPQVYYVTYQYVRPYFYDDVDDVLQDIPQTQLDMQDQIEELREEVRSIRASETTAKGENSDPLQKEVQRLQQALAQERRDRADELQALRTEVESLKEESRKKKRGFF